MNKNNMIYITNQERLNFAKNVNSILVSIYNCKIKNLFMPSERISSYG